MMLALLADCLALLKLYGVLTADDATRDTIIHVEAAIARLFVLAQPVGARRASIERLPPRHLPARPPVPPFSAARRFATMKIRFELVRLYAASPSRGESAEGGALAGR
jgi:hypothetical protein